MQVSQNRLENTREKIHSNLANKLDVTSSSNRDIIGLQMDANEEKDIKLKVLKKRLIEVKNNLMEKKKKAKIESCALDSIVRYETTCTENEVRIVASDQNIVKRLDHSMQVSQNRLENAHENIHTSPLNRDIIEVKMDDNEDKDVKLKILKKRLIDVKMNVNKEKNRKLEMLKKRVPFIENDLMEKKKVKIEIAKLEKELC